MTMLAAFAAAGLLARLCAAGPAGGDVQIEGNVSYEVGTGRVLVRDGAVLRRGGVVVRSRSATYDPGTGEVLATGSVLLTDDTRVLAADSVRAFLGGGVEAEDVVAFVKGEPVALSGAKTLDEARRLGRNRLSFSGAHLAGDLAGRFRLSRARLSLCDCGQGRAPSWEVTARKADVVPGRFAVLQWAVLRIAAANRSVPVLAVPWLYLPLGERQTGLLLPEIRSSGASGLVLAEPIFVTLGRSADATLTPEYAFGRSGAPRPTDGTVRGPGAQLELRWTPSEVARGQALLSWIHDLEREEFGVGGDRFGLDAGHGQRLSPNTSLAATLHLASDPVWVRDTTSDVLARTVPYRRSDALVSHRLGSAFVEASASYIQPLEPAGTGAGGPYGLLGSALDVSSRWPAASAVLLPVAAGPLRLSGRAGAVRFAPVAGAYDASGRPAADRGDLGVEVAAPWMIGRALSIAPYVHGAASAYAFEAAQDPRALAYGTAGAVVSTEVSRRFGEMRHAVAPRLEWRAGTAAYGETLAWPAYDLFDRSARGALAAAPPGVFQQLRASVESRLDLRGVDVFRLELGQDVNLLRGRLAETFGAASIAAGPLSADASVRAIAFETRAAAGLATATALGARAVPPMQIVLGGPLDRHFGELRANVALADRRGDAVRAGFFSVAPGGSGTLRAGMEPLFDLRSSPLDAGAGATAGARLVAGGATISYDAVFPGRASLVPRCGADPTAAYAALVGGDASQYRRVEGWEARQHTATVSFASRCRCFRVVAAMGVNDCGTLSYRASIDLSALAGMTRAAR